ncbi:MAG: NAD-dependent epimerase/dehydratase family protein [Desulforhopalus sp.]|nr:NAD-dependent epimerase/dehydratase family protein [Desulforhopalus sp.]
MKKALVTGGGGFVGKAVVKRLLELGVKTMVLGRHRYPDIELLGAECTVGNVSDAGLIDKATEGVDIVFHVAALAGIWGSWNEYYATNVLGTEVVVSSCRKNAVPMLVYTSTPSVVFNRIDIEGGDESLAYADEYLCNYAKSKVLAERTVLGANCASLLTCAIRPHLIWGPGDPHLLPRLLESGSKKILKRVGDGSNLVDISYIDNVAHAHILAAKNLSEKGTAAGKPYFISQGEPVNLWDWINELFVAMNIDEVKASLSFPVAYRLGAVLEALYKITRLKKEPKMTRFLAEQLAKSHYFSIENAQKDLGYEPVISTAEGLRRTVQWLKT